MAQAIEESNSASVLVNPPHDQSAVMSGKLARTRPRMVCGDIQPKEPFVCHYRCTDRKFAPQLARNIGNRYHPQWVDVSCYSAHNALKYQSKNDPKLKMVLATIQKTHPEVYRDKILAMRFDKLDPDSSRVQSCAKDRRALIGKLSEELKQYVNVFDNCSIAWFTEREFLGYHVNSLLYERKEAENLFAECKNNPKTKTITVASVTRYPCVMPVTTEVQRGRVFSRGYNTAETDPSLEDTASFTKIMAPSAMPNVNEGMFAGSGGDVFTSGSFSAEVPGHLGTLALPGEMRDDAASMPMPSLELGAFGNNSSQAIANSDIHVPAEVRDDEIAASSRKRKRNEQLTPSNYLSVLSEQSSAHQCWLSWSKDTTQVKSSGIAEKQVEY